MPIVSISSLPLKADIDFVAFSADLSESLYQRTGIDKQHTSVRWSRIEPGMYAVAGEEASIQHECSHPILVELLIPDLHHQETIEIMMDCIAQAIEKAGRVSKDNIFIYANTVRSSCVFDKGMVQRW